MSSFQDIGGFVNKNPETEAQHWQLENNMKGCNCYLIKKNLSGCIQKTSRRPNFLLKVYGKVEIGGFYLTKARFF